MSQRMPSSWKAVWRPATKIPAGAASIWEIDLVAGRAIPKGGVLRLLLNHPRIEWYVGEFFFSTDSDCRLQERIIYENNDRIPILECEVQEGRIRKGGRIKIILGDYSGKGRVTVAPKIADVTAPVILQARIPPGRRFVTVAEIDLTYIPAGPSRLNLNAVSPSSGGPLVVSAVDSFDNATPGLEDSVRVVSPNGSRRREITRTKLRRGKAVLKDWRKRAHGRGPLILYAESGGGLSNGATALMPGFYQDIGKNVFFGDLHLHCSGSQDGLHSPSWAYDYAKNVAGLAFCSITDHVYHLLDNGSWRKARSAARKANVPHEFVTFLGYEYDGHSEKGHMGVHFKEDVPQILVASSVPGLWEKLKKSGRECFTCPNHPNTAAEKLPLTSLKGWRSYDWDCHDEEMQPLAEIVQERGIFEMENAPGQSNGGYGSSLQSALRRGYHVGFLGGSDTHLGRPGTRSFSSWRRSRAELRAGLTAVIADELTRDSLWTAMKGRNTYATTGTRMLLDFRINDLLMGDRSILPSGKALHIRIRGLAPSPVVRVTVVKNGKTFAEYSPNARFFDILLDDKRPFAASLPCWSKECDFHSYYYVRVTQEDSHQAWASPIFFCH